MNLKNQNGYALLNVVLIFSIVTIFGISLLGMTLSSQKFTAYSESYTENLAVAEMKMDESMIRLENKINQFNNEVNLKQISGQVLTSELETNIKSLDLPNEGIKFVPKNIRTNTSGDNRFSEMVTIKVEIDDSSRYLTKTVTITSAADIFRFSTVTEGKLIFNGAASIKGDIFADNGIYLSKYAKFMVNNDFYTPLTDYPIIDGNIMVKKATSLGLKVFEGKEPNWHPVNDMSTLKAYLPNTPAVKDRSVQFEQFNIQKIISDKKQELDTKKNHSSDYHDSSIKSSKVINNSAVYKNYLVVESDLTVKGDLTLEEGINLTSKGSLKVAGNVYIKSSKKQTNALSGIIDITNNDNFIYIEGNTSISDLTVNSHIYNSGNVSIKKNLNMNGTIYVSGDSTIEDLSNKSGGTAVILSKGSLRVANNNVFQKTAREIDAFLYSDQDLEIYGVGSNIKINGGIYGKNITLNATKGETYPTSGYSSYNPNLNKSNFNSIGGLYIEKNQTNANLPSRLQIEFKPELIQNPPVGLPTVDKLQITEIDQKIE
ncbi:hypothetical protein [Peribacillus frigoritolerans]|uniref:hypothetical protein n=1 Tax=Peribacillus frigoritolerans TaxID=450367 RepID=UPI00105A7C4D|nr:hypothetical protein [Peribacillus frigoritolerans]TDL82135.1 hypothetical protein E2R53_00695 [Peribacillus frigoritolerans]